MFVIRKDVGLKTSRPDSARLCVLQEIKFTAALCLCMKISLYYAFAFT